MLFDAEHRLGSDRCALLARVRDNQSVLDYVLYDEYGICGTDCKERQSKLAAFASDHPSLLFVDGKGPAPCDIDRDSLLRQGKAWTHAKQRQQLRNRVFTSAPDLARGRGYPTLESALLSAQDTTIIKQCNRLGEKSFDRFTPNVDVQCVQNIIAPWTWGGDSSRDIARSKEFLQSIGFSLEDDAGTHVRHPQCTGRPQR